MKRTTFLLLLFIFGLDPVLQCQTYSPDWSSLDKRPIPQWYTDAKFGIFIHWGVYSVPAWAPASADIGVYAKYAEWYWMRINSGRDPNPQKTDVNQLFVDYHDKIWGNTFKYQDFAPLWKAELFDPVQWAELFKNSGAKYVILTSKHHDGFCLWPSEQSWNWNSSDIGPHRDLVGELSSAVKSSGLHMGLYYSLYEWFNPIYNSDPETYINQHMTPQMKDIVIRYEPDILYPDGEWDHPSAFWQSEQFLSWLYNESPVKENIVVNDRWGKETRSKHGGYYSSEYGFTDGGKTSENMSAHPWEEIRGIGTSFGYNRSEDLNQYLSSKELIEMLVQTVSEGGNLCLNIRPESNGIIPVIMQERLLDIGNWLKVNGEAIYASSPYMNRPANSKEQTVFYTVTGNNLNVICTAWPQEEFYVPGINSLKKISLLGSELEVTSRKSEKGLVIVPPLLNPVNSPCDHAWVFKISGCIP